MKTRVITTCVLAAGLPCGLGSAAHATLVCGARANLLVRPGPIRSYQPQSRVTARFGASFIRCAMGRPSTVVCNTI